MGVSEDAFHGAGAVSEAAAGEPSVAMEHLRRIVSPGVCLLSSLDRVEIAVQADEKDQGREWLAPLAAFAVTTGAPWAQARAAHCEALLGDVEGAPSHYERSLERHRRA